MTTRMGLIIATFTTAVLVLVAAGCTRAQARREIVEHGVKVVPHVDEITRLFPNAPGDHFIMHLWIDKGKPVKWTTRVFFGKRYEFRYVVPVMIDYQKNEIVKTAGPPTFVIWEVLKISSDYKEADIGANFRFTESDWGKVVQANGDFSVIGINLLTNSPVPRFEGYVKVRLDPMR